MFEKEAKEYVNEEYDFCYYPEDNLSTRINAERDWSKGAEFGYSKANEWHDLRKDPNDLPSPHCLNWVIALYDNGTLWCRARRKECIDGVFWVNSEYYPIDNVLAWKEITLPALPKEIKEKCLD